MVINPVSLANFMGLSKTKREIGFPVINMFIAKKVITP